MFKIRGLRTNLSLKISLSNLKCITQRWIEGSGIIKKIGIVGPTVWLQFYGNPVLFLNGPLMSLYYTLMLINCKYELGLI